MKTWHEQHSRTGWRIFWMTDDEVLFSAFVNIHPGQVPNEPSILNYFKNSKDWFIEMIPKPAEENKEIIKA